MEKRSSAVSAPGEGGGEDVRSRGRVSCTRRRLLAGGILAAAAAATYGMWDAEQLETNEIVLPEDALPGCNGLRVLHFSDLHNNGPLMNEVVRRASELRPDVIVFTGDLVTDFERLMRTRTIIGQLKKLVAVAPVYACLGNHDMGKLDEVERIFETAGVVLLRNAASEWKDSSGRALRIAGVGDWTEGDEDPACCLVQLGNDEQLRLPTLLLSHNPESRFALKPYAWNLMLSGHTHGGQIGNPLTGKCLSLRSKMAAGLYDFDGRRVFVTRGVGNIGGVRFFCPPEINLLTVASNKGS